MDSNGKITKLNNKGSSLIIVIICVLFVSVLGVLMLTITTMNLEMKNTGIKAADNFYTAENALDELKEGIYETASDTMADAYSYMLKNYTSTSESEKSILVKSMFANTLYTDFTNETVTESHVMTDEECEKLYKYFVITKVRGTDTYGVSLESNPTVVINRSSYTVTLKGVSLSYLDKNGYESKITTDMVIMPNYPDTLISENKEDLYYSDYVVINDGNINVLTSSSIFNGNVYTGDGLNVNGPSSSLNIYADKFISRGSISVSDKAQLNMEALNVLSNELNVWTANIETSSTLTYVSPKNYITINGNCNVADDLTLSATGGNVIITGSYYGYSSSNANAENRDGDPQYSSAVNINASNAVLDLSGLTELWVAGKSYISVPDHYGSTVTDISTVKTLMGESVSFKGNQIAYLLPGVCINGLSHNPVTVDEYNKILSGEYSIDISLSGQNGGIALENYLNPNTPYVAVPVRYINDSEVNGMFYIYMKFMNSDKASEYYSEYFRMYGTDLEERASSLGLGSVILNENIVNAGNVLEFNNNSLSITTKSDSEGNEISYNDTLIEAKELELSSKYHGLINVLKEDYHSNEVSESLTDNLIYFEDGDGITGIISDSMADGYACILNDGPLNPYYIRICDRDVVIDGNHELGLVITTGNVTVNGNFNGLIIAKGDVTVNQNAVLSYSDDIEKLLIDNPDIIKYFKDFKINADAVETESAEDEPVTINYENWYKD